MQQAIRLTDSPRSPPSTPASSMPKPAYESPIGPGMAGPGEPFWMEKMRHQGTSPFNPNPEAYQVFRNVKEFGAIGDGIADDTEAINAAMSSGGRCGGGNWESSTVVPAIVYFPQGTYKVSGPIIAYYYTQIIGDARVPPTLLAASNFSGMAVIDADPYIPGGGGAQWYINQNNFFRSVRNFVIDLRRVPDHVSATGIHWQVSQATSLMNILFSMSERRGNAHQGIWMENGSGGYMGDLVFQGGKFGMWVGNQQFTVRNITINNAETAVYGIWNWGWTFQGVNINNCQVGFDLKTGGKTKDDQSVGGEAIIDAVVTNTPIFVRSSISTMSLAGSLVLNNIQLTDVPVAVGVLGGEVVLPGGTMTVDHWVQGNVYSGTNHQHSFVKGHLPAPVKTRSFLDETGRVFGRMHPQYEDYAVDQFVSVKSLGAKGDGRSDDTAILQSIFDQYSGKKIIFFDAGTYYITDTLAIPAGTQMVGEVWSVIMGGGSAFGDQRNPKVMVRVGEPGSRGILEISDILFATRGPTPGAIVVEWNVYSDIQGGAGMWDSHIRLAGAAGTNLELAQCPTTPKSSDCFAAFLSLHLTPTSNAYLESTWVWLADHDLDGDGRSQITVYSGRGILSESAGPVWMIGTGSEHHTLYQYNLVNARDHYMGLIQTESPYYQPTPVPPAPFTIEEKYHDPTFPAGQPSAWAVNVQSSSNIFVFGAGLYSFFHNYDQACLKDSSCQSHVLNIDSISSISIYGLSTVGTTYMLSVDHSGVIPAVVNMNGFQSTATAWTR
ncbi:glycoside hydrolase family 55 protein [Laetiporus sulphureus 93-53]|uniref:Glycoside hydrolase family 55 protein n=1 Tax=Laetiporus sulphureus 93-53 TaxID=1314785 RepID=A0A165F1P3_9APHY|nr:glycoside hydrolase family 55 protein [Laetiporus sulphureus 93-53]KZT08185.1 glycoside hydrolase family 55 protein [Laetiporus sulphureus 93-53]